MMSIVIITLEQFQGSMILYRNKHRKTKTCTSQSKEKPAPRLMTTNSHKGIKAKDHSAFKDVRTTHDIQSTLTSFQPPSSMVSLYLRKTQTSMLKKRPINRRMEIFQPRPELPDISTSNWCLYDSVAKKYIGFREDYKREVASLTKIMTTFLSLELIHHFHLQNYFVRITNTAANLIGTTANLKAFHWISIQDLLYGAMLPSGNDAAYSLAQYLGYAIVHAQGCLVRDGKEFQLDLTQASTSIYVQQFLKAMNDKAKILELTSTRFSNPHGLQNALNQSTPKDMIKLSRKAIKNYLFRDIVNTKSYQYNIYQNLSGGDYLVRKWNNTNRLLDKGWEGIKTGCTATAGNCLASLREGVFIVVLNSQNDSSRFSDTEKVYSWYQEHREKKQTKSVLVARPQTELGLRRPIKTQPSF